jgi:AMP deaminase
MPHYAVNPSQTARLNSSYSANDMLSLAQKSSQAGPAKSRSMIFTPPGGLSAQAPPQPPMIPSSTFPLSGLQPLSPTLTRTETIVNMDGSEPKMFPGVVMNRHRRSSLQRPDSSGDAVPSGQSWGRRSDVGEAVVEEEEISPNKTPIGGD